jgi:hypothetical protein
MQSSDLRVIPGIGRTFVKDFARIGVLAIRDLRRANPEELFRALVRANMRELHPTSRNDLYVIRMAVYFANGGRDPDKLRWHAWKDAPPPKRRSPSK